MAAPVASAPARTARPAAPAQRPAPVRRMPVPAPARPRAHPLVTVVTVEVAASSLSPDVLAQARALATRQAVEQKARAYLPADVAAESLRPALDAAAEELGPNCQVLEQRMAGGVARVTAAVLVSSRELVGSLIRHGVLPSHRLLVYVADPVAATAGAAEPPVAAGDLEQQVVAQLLEAGHRVFSLRLSPGIPEGGLANISTPEEAALLRKAAEGAGVGLVVLVDGITVGEDSTTAAIVSALGGTLGKGSRICGARARGNARVVVARSGEVLAVETGTGNVTCSSLAEAARGALQSAACDLAAKVAEDLAKLTPAQLTAAGVTPSP